MNVISELSVTSEALERCKAEGNKEWKEKHEKYLKKLLEYLPNGSGYDNGTHLVSITPQKAIFQTSFHHMNDVGFYDGWTDHKVTVCATFSGIEVNVSGRNKNNITEMIADDFHFALMQEVDREGNLFDENYKKFRELTNANLLS